MKSTKWRSQKILYWNNGIFWQNPHYLWYDLHLLMIFIAINIDKARNVTYTSICPCNIPSSSKVYECQGFP